LTSRWIHRELLCPAEKRKKGLVDEDWLEST
jgi:hypothetical protein